MLKFPTYQPKVSDTVSDNEYQEIEEAKRDPERFRVLYERYFKMMFLFIHRKVDDKNTSADLASQVFLKALLHLPGYQHQGLPFSAWLYRIAINEVMQFFRKNQRIRQVVIDDYMLSRLREETEEATLENLQKQLSQVIEQLSLAEVQLIELRFYENKSFKEIAYILEISENTAKVRAFRLLEKIREAMRKLNN
ncbi:sigma-70 family RNA polymerase sigma factor [Rhodocytophaga aerolata]|uniref:Sigma-70 family RNA polymerase sigma factor n=1 Tax=Rhodocytophaga aerolata TaxID=455078 RepID=A0ABT8R7I2_9BACT|nr:sigma-70 family RNA polymerase sigma factor [Rhodocytophaga aerolata]MDO1448068.1 sigma-70 family RNA polymerase sigma factor [Rhodocytophaga aerolata]